MSLNDAIHKAVNFANQGRLDQAEKTCRDIIAKDGNYHPAYHLLGQLSFRSGRDDIAAEMLHKAVLLDQSSAPYKCDLAEVLCICGKPKDAMMFVEGALKLNPNYPKTHYIAGMALTRIGALENAIQAYNTTIKLSPNHGPAYNNLGTVLEASGRPDKAKEAYSQAVKINEKHVEAQNNLGAVLVAEGDIDQAKKHFETAIKEQPSYIEAHHNLSALKNYKKDDEHINILETIERDTSRLSPDNQIRLNFTLGKAYTDIQNYDDAFDYYNKGNSAKRARFDYNEQASEKFIENIKDNFSKAYFKNYQKDKSEDLRPIFIVGMPRSGSTLIEQIISSHSQAYAGGELMVLAEIIKAKINNFPQGVNSLSNQELKSIGNEYLNYINNLNPDAKCIIDKMPANYQYAGLIAKILPGARIINAKRSPMDCCLSIY
ncbi:MAG: tetratricopeptide repeat protein, partial [Kordiimonadaceae bacterium]|nr:tetratricopeptide repeat protein [Kordiimonadaceae bacterium]